MLHTKTWRLEFADVSPLGLTFAPCVSLLRAAAVSLSTLSQFCIQVSSFIVRCARTMDLVLFVIWMPKNVIHTIVLCLSILMNAVIGLEHDTLSLNTFPFWISGKTFPFYPNPLLDWFWDLKHLFFQLFGEEQMVCSWTKMFNQIRLVAIQEYTAQGWKNAKMSFCTPFWIRKKYGHL